MPLPDERILCRDYMVRKCFDRNCRHMHDPKYCKLHWEGHCPYGNECRNRHDFPAENKKDRELAVKAAERREKEKRDAFERALISKGIDPNSPEAARMLLGQPVPRADGDYNRGRLAGDQEHGDDEGAGRPQLIMPPRTVRRRPPFNPETCSPDLRIVVDPSPHRLAQRPQVRDLSIHPCIFNQPGDETIYERLVDEISAVAIENQVAMLAPWHGDTHWVVDDATGWKKRSPTYQMVLDRVVKYFNLTVTAARVNWYKDSDDYKPFHHDSAALAEDKAALQNFSVGVSFGATRELAFEEVETRHVVSIPVSDGYVYAFARDANILWRHGVLKTPSTKRFSEGRISIVIWGWTQLEEVIAPPPPLIGALTLHAKIAAASVANNNAAAAKVDEESNAAT
jgi:hypothetical protein